ncbi:MAG: hypothetical protein Kow0059_14780 [Candidatus Sumerlaeia bacterium]
MAQPWQPISNHQPIADDQPGGAAGACAGPVIARPPWRLLFFFIFVTYAYFYHSGQHNDNARFDQTRMIVESGELHIDKYRFNTADVVVKDVPVFAEGTSLLAFLPWRERPEPVRVEKHCFPNKAPGTSFFAVPVWWALTKVFSLFDLPRWIEEHLIPYLTIVFTIGLMSALAALCLYGVLEHLLHSAPLAWMLTAAWALGSIAFPFATLFFSHQLAASLLLISFAIVYCYKTNAVPRGERERGDGCALPFNSPLWLGLSGFLAGFALTTEYPTVLAVGPLALYTTIMILKLPGRRWRWLPLYAAGIVAGGLFLVWYNIKIDGRIFYIPYEEYAAGRNAIFQEHKQGFMGVTFIKDKQTFELIKTNLEHITFGRQRGLFFCNPWTVLVLPSLLLWWLWRGRRWEGALAAVIVVAFFLFNAGYGKTIVFWGGGWSVGPRHIIPMLPFLTLLVGAVVRWLPVRLLFYPLLLVSLGIMLMATAVEPRVPYEYQHPVRDLFWQNYVRGRLAIYDFGVFNSTFLTPDSVAFNWGKLVRLRPEYQLAPLFAFWALMSWRLLRAVGRRHEGLRAAAREAALSGAQRGLNPQSDLMEYMQDVLMKEKREPTALTPVERAVNGPEAESPPPVFVSPPASEGSDRPQDAAERNSARVDDDISEPPLNSDPPPVAGDEAVPVEGMAEKEAVDGAHGEAPLPLSDRSWRRTSPTRSKGSILAWFARENDPRRLIYARFHPTLAFCLVLLYIAFMFGAPLAYAWQERRKITRGQGLMGRYLRGVEWPSRPPRTWKPGPIEAQKIVLKRLDQIINFNWTEQAPPIPGAFSVIWEGWIYIPQDGAWTFATESDDGSALYLDGRLVVDNWGSHMPQTAQGRLFLKTGYHEIVVIYYNEQFGATMRLKWAPPGAHLQPVPTEYLFVSKPGDEAGPSADTGSVSTSSAAAGAPPAGVTPSARPAVPRVWHGQVLRATALTIRVGIHVERLDSYHSG